MIPAIPKDAKEIVSKRSRNAKHFRLPDGSFLCRASARAIHYLDEAREWKDVDLNVDEKLEVERAEYIARVSADQVAFTYESRRGGLVRALLVAIEGRPLSEHKLNVKPESDANRVIWNDLLPELDIELRFFPSGAEFFKILRGDRAPRSFTWEYRWRGKIPNVRLQKKTKGWDREKINRPVTKDRKGFVRRTVEIVNETEEFFDEATGETVFRLTETYTGRAAVPDEKRVRRLKKETSYPVTIDASVSEEISAGGDDVQESMLQNTISTGGTKIKLGYGPLTIVSYRTTYGTFTTFAALQYAGGFRFQSVGIPTGATISTAKLTLTNQGAGPQTGGAWDLKVAADDVDDAAAWSTSNRPTQISKVGQVSLNVVTSFGSPVGPHTAALTTAVQAILNRSGWAQNNDMRFGIEPGTGGLSSSQWISVEAFEHTGTSEAVLDVTYAVAAQTLQMVWNVKALAAAVTQLIWNVNTLATASTQLIWNVYVSMNAPVDLGLQWDVRKAVGQDLSLLWNVASIGAPAQGAAHIHGPTKPVLGAKDKRIDLKGQDLRIQLGEITARVDAVEVLSLAAAKARPGKLYAVGEEQREKRPGKPAKSQDVALVYILSLVEGEEA